MKTNKEILTEGFFKKTYSEKMAKKMKPLSYEPLDKQKMGNPGFGSVLDTSGKSIYITDPAEVKKRLTGAFGAIVGNNTIRSMSNKAIKTFPIIISDNIEPETAVMLKRVTEEQYASYMSLLISNQVIDVSQFSTDNDENTGNIAIQALDSVSGNDFSKQSKAQKAMSGEFNPDDMFGNFSMYNLMRQESMEIKTGDSLLDSLLENAVIVPNEKSDLAAAYIINEANNILNEVEPRNRNENPTPIRDTTRDNKPKSASDVIRDYTKEATAERDKYDKKLDALSSKNRYYDYAAGFEGLDDNGDPVYSKLSNPDILLKPQQFKIAMNKSIGEVLNDPKNDALKDRFEKATFLLQANSISGGEYISYLTQRLGIPIDSKTRIDIVSHFKERDVRSLDGRIHSITKAQANNLMHNRRIVTKYTEKITKTVMKDVLIATAAGGVAGTGAGLGALAASSSGVALLLTPLGIGALAGAIVGVGTLVALLIKAHNKRKAMNKVEGWERVEMLINDMDSQRNEVMKNKSVIDKSSADHSDENLQKIMAGVSSNDPLDVSSISIGKDLTIKNIDGSPIKDNDNTDLSKVDMIKLFDAYQNSSIIKEDAEVQVGKVYFDFTEDTINYINETYKYLMEELSKDKDYKATVLSESVISTTTPITVKQIYQYDSHKKPDVLVTPTLSARSMKGYGSVEYDTRDIKDRRYNSPLILKVTFKERLSDGTYTDNELTAVIGILGIINRVPSNEMEYILKSNTEGNTIKGIIRGDKKVGDLVSDLLAGTKVKKDVDSLKVSGDVWNNLEKIARLAAVNKLAGQRNNNVANAHIIFSQKEIDDIKSDTGIDYLKDKDLSASLMKRYSAFTLMVANDVSQRLAIFDDLDSISWNIVPYTALLNKDNSDQLASALMNLSNGRR